MFCIAIIAIYCQILESKCNFSELAPNLVRFTCPNIGICKVIIKAEDQLFPIFSLYGSEASDPIFNHIDFSSWNLKASICFYSFRNCS